MSESSVGQHRNTRPALLGGALLALLALGLVACAALQQPGPADAEWATSRWPDSSLAELVRGRALYVQRCSGCHGLPRPERYTPAQWDKNLDAMAERAELQPGERELLLRFLLTVGRPGRVEPPPPQK